MKKLIFTLLCLSLAGSSYAATIIVKADGSGDYPTIQAAIDAAGNGDVVELQPGTYTGPGNRDISFLGKAITVRGATGNPNDVIIDCNGTYNEPYRGFRFVSGEDANSILENLTITDGYGPKEDVGSVGGGMFCRNSSPLIQNCIITRNTGYIFGGGIYNSSLSNPTIRNCSIFANSANEGGGICNYYGSSIIQDCKITQNSAYYRGGGIINYYSDGTTIIKCTIARNSSHTYGGGIDNYESSPIIENCVITENSISHFYGGGINNYSSNPVIRNCIISNNSVLGIYSKSGGGGIYINDCELTVTNCTFAGNFALNGKALACDSWLSCQPSNLLIVNCILWDAADEIWNNDGSTITITYSDVRGGWEGEGNIDADPCFVDPDVNDFHLLPDSPSIDKGDPNYIPKPNETDLDGLPRVMGARIDMGCYEFASNIKPVAVAGPNQIAYAWIDGFAEVILDGNDSYDPDGNELTYLWSWTIDGNDYDANGVNPTIYLPAGLHTIQLIVNDGCADSEPDETTITVIALFEMPMHFTPRMLNPKSKGKWVKAHFILPAGFGVGDVNTNSPAMLVEPFTAESVYMDVFINEDGLVKIMAAFDRADFCSNGSAQGNVVVIGKLTTGQYFYGTDTIRIKTNNLEYLAVLTSYWLEAGCGEPDWCAGADLDRDSVVDFIDFALFDGCCLEFIQN